MHKSTFHVWDIEYLTLQNVKTHVLPFQSYFHQNLKTVNGKCKKKIFKTWFLSPLSLYPPLLSLFPIYLTPFFLLPIFQLAHFSPFLSVSFSPSFSFPTVPPFLMFILFCQSISKHLTGYWNGDETQIHLKFSKKNQIQSDKYHLIIHSTLFFILTQHFFLQWRCGNSLLFLPNWKSDVVVQNCHFDHKLQACFQQNTEYLQFDTEAIKYTISDNILNRILPVVLN